MKKLSEREKWNELVKEYFRHRQKQTEWILKSMRKREEQLRKLSRRLFSILKESK